MNLNLVESKIELQLKSLEERKSSKGTYEFVDQDSNCFTSRLSKRETTKNGIKFSIQGMSNNTQLLYPRYPNLMRCEIYCIHMSAYFIQMSDIIGSQARQLSIKKNDFLLSGTFLFEDKI